MKLDILLPLYAPGAGWEKNVIDAVVNLRREIGPSVDIHLYICNDGAADEYYSREALEAVSNAVNGNFHFLKYEKNRGKGYSVRHLVSNADGDYIIYTDGDFPFGWRSIAEAFKQLTEGTDVIMGRRNRSYGEALPLFRKCLSGGVRFLNRLLCGLPDEIQDTQAGLKGFNRRGREIFLQTTVDSFVFDTEFILLAYNRKLKISPLDVDLSPDLKMSSMGLKVLFGELVAFAGVLWRVRVKKCCRK